MMKKPIKLVGIAAVVVAALTAGILVAAGFFSPSKTVSTQLSETLAVSATSTARTSGKLSVTSAVPTSAMTKSLPAIATLIAVADFSFDGDFPAAGMEISYSHTQPVAPGKVAILGFYNEATDSWEYARTSISEDRKSFTATVPHFSLWGLLEVGPEFIDNLQKAIGGDLDWGQLVPKLAESVAEGVGVQTKRPECPEDNAHWGGVVAYLNDAAVLWWCGFEKDGAYTVRVTNNTPWTAPLHTPVKADDVTVVDPGLPGRTSNLMDAMGNPSEANGASHIVKIVAPTLDNNTMVHFLPPLGTIDFQYSLDTVEKNWTALKSNGGIILKEVDSQELIMTDFLLKIVDTFSLTALQGNIPGLKGVSSDLYAGLLSAVDSCWNIDYAVNDLHALHELIGCLADGTALKKGLAAAAADMDKGSSATGSNVTRERASAAGTDGFLKAFQRALIVFDAIDLISYQARWMVSTFDTTRSITMNPTAAFAAYFDSLDEWTVYTTPDTLNSFELPPGWTAEEGEATYHDSRSGEGVLLTVYDNNKKEIATYQTGISHTGFAVGPAAPAPSGSYGRTAMPQLDNKRPGYGSEWKHHFEMTVWKGFDGTERLAAVVGSDSKVGGMWKSAEWSTGVFSYAAGQDGYIPGTTTAEPLAQRAEAYSRSVHFHQLKRMMSSLSFTATAPPAAKELAPVSTATAAGTAPKGSQKCSGTQWDFELVDVDCQTALKFFQELTTSELPQRVAAGWVWDGHGGCMGGRVNYPTPRGSVYDCNMGESGTFLVWKKGERRD